jgi:lipoprotein Spr
MTTPVTFPSLVFLAFPIGLFISCQHGPSVEEPEEKLSIEKRILLFYDTWQGTPYKLGGMDTSGIDCSALTQRLYKDVFELELPRRVVEQRVEGIEVPRDSLKPGDLIIFRGSLFGRPHIGIHVKEGDFIHASSSKGVTISNLSEHYWKRKFKMARRMINEDGKLLLDAE